jgi:radical SAM superfamily enzyme YgiQ (UPF0313 family)
MTLARVFPRKTNATPDDEYAFVGFPPDKLPDDITEINISTAFSYDLAEAERLYAVWSKIAQCSIRGPATGQKGEEFVPGKFLKNGYTITSRGCPSNRYCWHCTVPTREGKTVRELPIRRGWNILVDNILACSESHIRAVFQMLEDQKKQGHRAFSLAGSKWPE